MVDREALYDALRNADAAGDTAAAQRLADYIRSLPPVESTPAQVSQRQAPSTPPAAGATAERSADGTLVLSMSHEDATAPASQAPASAPTTAQQIQASIPGRVMQGLRDPLDAVAQMVVRAVPPGVQNTLNTAVQYVNDLPVVGAVTRALGMTPATTAQLDEQIRQNEAAYQAARAATGSSGLDIARLSGNVLGTIALAPAAASATGSALGTKAGIAAASGALFGGLQPVLEGDFGAEKLKQMGVGVGTGLLGGMAGNALARIISPRASTNPQIQQLLNEGVTPTPGQMMGGLARTVEDKAISVPILGDAIRSARQRGIKEFNLAALNRVTAPLGVTIKDAGREGVRQAHQAVSEAYDAIIPRLAFRADRQFAQELAQIQHMAQALPPDRLTQFQRIIDDKVIGKLTPQGGATGQNFREIESELGRLARNYISSPDADQRTLGAALLEVQSSLREALARANPQAADELRRINEAYALLTRVERAAASTGAESGVFTPSQLSAAVRASDSTIRRNRFARGEALMQDLSDAGRSVLNSTVPNSGTADRLMLNAGALGAGLYNPLIPMGLGMASIPYLMPANRLVALALARRPNAAPQVAEQIGRVTSALGILSGPAAYQAAGN